MEILITLIVIAIIFWKVFSVIRKIFVGKSKDGKDTSMGQVLRDIGEKIKKELEAQKAKTDQQQQQGRATGWENLFDPEEIQAEEEEMAELVEISPEAPPPPPVPGPGVRRPPPERLRTPGPEAPRPLPEETGGPCLEGTHSPAPETLRKMIVWSEILSPPVSLREDR